MHTFLQNPDLHEELARLAQRVWRARDIPGLLIDDPQRFLENNGIALPTGYEVRVTANKEFISFRFLPRRPADVGIEVQHRALRDGGSGELLFRFEFKLVWD
jgi:hypothetical protein